MNGPHKLQRPARASPVNIYIVWHRCWHALVREKYAFSSELTSRFRKLSRRDKSTRGWQQCVRACVYTQAWLKPNSLTTLAWTSSKPFTCPWLSPARPTSCTPVSPRTPPARRASGHRLRWIATPAHVHAWGPAIEHKRLLLK